LGIEDEPIPKMGDLTEQQKEEERLALASTPGSKERFRTMSMGAGYMLNEEEYERWKGGINPADLRNRDLGKINLLTKTEQRKEYEAALAKHDLKLKENEMMIKDFTEKLQSSNLGSEVGMKKAWDLILRRDTDARYQESPSVNVQTNAPSVRMGDQTSHIHNEVISDADMRQFLMIQK